MILPEPAVCPKLHRGQILPVFRPIQYLGSKLRSLATILSVRNAVFEGPITVLDPFVGSSVVAQAFALNGDKLIGSDALSFCNHIAVAVLGVGMTSSRDVNGCLERLATQRDEHGERLFVPWLKAEDAALKNGDGEKLIEISFAVPQVWRSSGATHILEQHFTKLSAGAFTAARGFGAVIASFYAGTYFGVRQALDLDALCGAIHSAHESGMLAPWEFSVAIAALCSAASTCVFSAGKHFAQPYLVDKGKITAFACKRILNDRAVCVRSAFRSAAEQIIAAAERNRGGHAVFWSPFESITSRIAPTEKVDLLYADPPYTRQQYSRFYHILETLSAGRVPDIQMKDGLPTRGIYPTDRFKSRFCSKKVAPTAFTRLFSTAEKLQSSVLLSYSFSGRQTGNERMITLEEILALDPIERGQFKPTVHEFGHQFRTFNSAEVEGASDREFLIFFENRAAEISR